MMLRGPSRCLTPRSSRVLEFGNEQIQLPAALIAPDEHSATESECDNHETTDDTAIVGSVRRQAAHYSVARALGPQPHRSSQSWPSASGSSLSSRVMSGKLPRRRRRGVRSERGGGGAVSGCAGASVGTLGPGVIARSETRAGVW